MYLYKTKDIELENLIDKIEKATQEDRFVVLSIKSNNGIVSYKSNNINIKEMVIYMEDEDGKKILIFTPRSTRKTLPTLHMDITNDRAFHIKYCGNNGGTRDPLTDKCSLCRLYLLYTSQTDIDGYPSCVIRIHIEEKQD